MIQEKYNRTVQVTTEDFAAIARIELRKLPENQWAIGRSVLAKVGKSLGLFAATTYERDITFDSRPQRG